MVNCALCRGCDDTCVWPLGSGLELKGSSFIERGHINHKQSQHILFLCISGVLANFYKEKTFCSELYSNTNIYSWKLHATCQCFPNRRQTTDSWKKIKLIYKTMKKCQPFQKWNGYRHCSPAGTDRKLWNLFSAKEHSFADGDGKEWEREGKTTAPLSAEICIPLKMTFSLSPKLIW